VTQSADQNRQIIRRYYEELWNGWNYSLIDELIASDVTFRGSLGVSISGRTGFRTYMSTVQSAFPDFHNSIENLIVEGETVVARLSYRGTHLGALFGVAPTGVAVTYPGVAIFRCHRGMIADGWVIADTAALMRQVGIQAAWPGR
jgi:steroid delta-isomerase-like uncharacterized protein